MDRTGANIYDKLKFNFKIWLSTRDDEGIISDKNWKILKAIEKHGSLSAATKELGITYRGAWNELKKIEEILGFALIEKARGGINGGNTTLTREGRNLLRTFDKLHNKMESFIKEAFVETNQEQQR